MHEGKKEEKSIEKERKIMSLTHVKLKSGDRKLR